MQLYTLEELNQRTWQWSEDRGINTNGKPQTQALKLASEVGELCDNIAKGKDIKDDIGDCLVVLTNLATLTGTTLEECWSYAYDDIKDRKGFLNEQGNFIKSTDPAYAQLLAKHTGQPLNIKARSLHMVEDASSLMIAFIVTANLDDNTIRRFKLYPNDDINIASINNLCGENIKTIRSILEKFGEVHELTD